MYDERIRKELPGRVRDIADEAAKGPIDQVDQDTLREAANCLERCLKAMAPSDGGTIHGRLRSLIPSLRADHYNQETLALIVQAAEIVEAATKGA